MSTPIGEGETVSLHAIARGRVQGVGFREFVRRTANALGLTGWVRNLADARSVEVTATGTRPLLNELLRRLRDGPRFAHVTAIDTDWSATNDGVIGFEIRY